MEEAMKNENVEFRKNLALMRQTGMFCDATICIPGETKTLPVHRAIMSSCSEYFRSLFTNGLQETLQNEVSIHDISVKMMELLIDYAYTKEVLITPDNAVELFAAADRFNVLGLLQDCIDFFATEIAMENCIGFLRFARHYNNKQLKDICWVFITSHFTMISESSEEFVQLTADELLEIIKDDKLSVRSEDDVFNAVIRWIEFAPRERKETCSHLLSGVRFPFITETCFRDKILKRRDLKRTGPCWERINQSYQLVKKFRSSKDPMVKSQTASLAKWIKPRIPSHIIFVIGGWAKEGVTDKWYEIQTCEMPQPRAYHGTVTIEDKVFVVGGFNGTHYLNSVASFDVCYVSAVEIDGMLFVCGGYDGRQRHNSTERYDRSRNQWTLLYVAGGFDGTSCLFSAEQYDPVADQWTVLAPMSTRRSGVSLVTTEGRVYAVGGYDGQRRLETVEYFDLPRRHWYESTSMLLGRSNFSCVVMDGLIYAMGGYDGEKTSPETECYHPEDKRWDALNDMNIGRSAVSACAVTDIYNARDFSFHGNETMITCSGEGLTPATTAFENAEYSRILTRWRRSPLGESRSDMDLAGAL
ncbi:KLH10-like protein [Mya arenaria]|uniref:KLH10-like protein n=1 Tax=Mya arenaria TaxID=6604 RepID=A0ABY7FZ98_MYAAR|nr:KLH10-like protein [Mya arenaria]